MTLRTICGLQFIVLSPSLLRLVGYPIEVLFAGSMNCWCITISNSLCTRTWRSRDAAIAALASALQAKGAEANA